MISAVFVSRNNHGGWFIWLLGLMKCRIFFKEVSDHETDTHTHTKTHINSTKCVLWILLLFSGARRERGRFNA